MRRWVVIAVVLVLAVAGLGLWWGLSNLSASGPRGLEFVVIPSTPVVNESATFVATYTGDPKPTDYAWSFGDGSQGAGPTATHTYAGPGTYDVSVTASGGGSVTATASKEVTAVLSTVPPPPTTLTGSFTFQPANPTVGGTVNFTASASGGTPPYTFAWAFGDGATAIGASVSHAYTAAGNYTVTLDLGDSGSQALSVPKSLTVGAAPPPSGRVDYIVTILMENHAICDILTTCGGTGTYETSLAQTYGLATAYVDCASPSLPNYLCLTGGTDFGCSGYDGAPNSNACTATAWGSTNLVDRLEAAALTWKAYMEDMPSNCYGSDSGNYAVRHDPFVYYSDIVNSASRCARVIPAGSGDSALLGDLASTSTASNFMWLTPNVCNDMHNCGVSTGDAYLAGLVPQILGSNVFKTQRAALFITFDEDSGGSGSPNLYTVWAGPVTSSRYTSGSAYNHFSFLATLEANWNLQPLTSNDGAAAPMSGFFTSPLVATQALVTYAAGSPGPSPGIEASASGPAMCATAWSGDR